MAKLMLTTALLSLVFVVIVAGHDESPSCVYSVMEQMLEKMFKLRTRMDEWERRFTELEDQVNSKYFVFFNIFIRILLLLLNIEHHCHYF
jgi:hypothetical protein